jgi:hypothetical protein
LREDEGRTCVFQVVEPHDIKRRSYEVVGRVVESRLSGDAICSADSGRGCRLTLLIPESAVVDISSTTSEASSLIGDRDELRRVLMERAGRLSFADAVEVSLLPCMGFYVAEGFSLSCKGVDHGDVEVSIFKEILLHTLFKGCRKVVFDLSTGHSMYVTAAMKALRSSIVAHELGNLDRLLLHGSFGGQRFYKAFSSPTAGLRAEERPVRIMLEEADARVFFDFPLDYDSINSLNIRRFVNFDVSEVREVAKRYSALTNRIRHVLKVGLYLHNAIKHNVPLAFYYAEEILGERLNGEEAVRLLLDLIELIEREGWSPRYIRKLGEKEVEVTYRGVSRRRSLYTMLGLLETSALIRLLHSLTEGYDLEDGVSIEKIRRDFIEGIYSRYNVASSDLVLNKRMLERDLREILVASKGLGEEGCDLLKNLIPKSPSSGTFWPRAALGDEERNFFAHSGFSKEVTLVCRRGEDVKVRYLFAERRHPRPEEIERWVERPAG